MTDIVEWLRAYANRTTVIDIKRLDEAAAEIERLREWNREIALNGRELVAENERLRAALRDMLRLVEDDEDDPAPYLIDVVCDRARAALDGQPAPGKEEA